MEPSDFNCSQAHPDSFALCEELLQNAQEIENDAINLTTNEFGELVDEEELNTDELTENEQLTPYTVNTDTSNVVNNTPQQSNNLSENTGLTTPPTPNRNATWLKNSILAPSESDKEFELFSCYCRLGGGRSLQYVSQITNFSISKLQQVAKRNNWLIRVGDFDRYQLSKKLNEAQDARHQKHLSRLEAYREQQEQIGHQLSLNAARIAYLADRKLTKLLDSEQDLDVRDLPSMLNAASKLAEVGKNLQSNALGVDQLLAAIEESEVD